MSPWVGPGRDESPLDHQVVEPAAPHPGQESSAARLFHLEDAQRVRPESMS